MTYWLFYTSNYNTGQNAKDIFGNGYTYSFNNLINNNDDYYDSTFNIIDTNILNQIYNYISLNSINYISSSTNFITIYWESKLYTINYAGLWQFNFYINNNDSITLLIENSYNSSVPPIIYAVDSNITKYTYNIYFSINSLFRFYITYICKNSAGPYLNMTIIKPTLYLSTSSDISKYNLFYIIPPIYYSKPSLSLSPYTSSSSPYTSSSSPYTSSSSPYTSSSSPYTSSSSPYTSSSSSPYTSSQIPYTSSQIPYTSSQIPYTSSQIPYTSSQISYSGIGIGISICICICIIFIIIIYFIITNNNNNNDNNDNNNE
jgi:hypothetical protein